MSYQDPYHRLDLLRRGTGEVKGASHSLNNPPTSYLLARRRANKLLTSKVNGVFVQIHSQDRMSSRCSKRLIRKGSERQGVTLNNSGGY